MSNIAIVTGAGSGVGRAVAQRLAAEGWYVAALGRRSETVEETASVPGQGSIHPIGCDISDATAVDRAVREVVHRFGSVHALVNCAGINIPNRALEKLSVEDFRRVIDVNLTGAFYCVRAVLPVMRTQGAGTIVNVVSDAGMYPNVKAGGAYVASKFGLDGLTQMINLEERPRGIRACAIFPGDINTPLLDKRPVPPPAEARERMLQPDDIVECVMLAISLPPRAVIEQILVRPA